MTIYIDSFTSWKDVQKEFNTDHPKPDEVYYANYTREDYEGFANITFRHNGKYYHASGSHCSCYGLEDQFDPEEFETLDIFMEYLSRIVEIWKGGSSDYSTHAKITLKKVRKEKKSLENKVKLV